MTKAKCYAQLAGRRYSLEIELEEAVCQFALEYLGVISKKLKAAGERGWPDRMFLIPGGRPLFIEFKRHDGELSHQQKIIIRRMQHYGYDVRVHDTFAEAVAAIEQACQVRAP